MPKLWLTRPRQYAEKTAQALSHYDLALYPLLEYRLLSPSPVAVEQGSVVAFTSAFAVEAYAKAYHTDIKAFCVGDSTAQTAQRFGMQTHSAHGDVEALQKLIASHVKLGTKIWHFAATETAGDLQGALQSCGYEVQKVALYGTETCQKLEDTLCHELQQGMIHGVLLYSPKTAETFMKLIQPLGNLPNLKAFCLSQNVADKISGIGQVFIAQKPVEDSLISLIHQQFGTE